MKTSNKLTSLLALAILPLFSNAYAELPFNYAKASAAYANAGNTASGMLDRIYFGGSFGASQADNYCKDIKSCENKDSSWKAFAGYKINELLSAEVAYTSIGDLHQKGEASDISALSATGVANLPINGQFGIFGKAGFSHWRTENTESNKSDTGMTYGLGAKVSLSESMKLRAEWEHLPSIETSHTEETNINMLSIGIELSTY